MEGPHRLEELRIDRSEGGPEGPRRRRGLLLGLSVLLVGAAGWWLLGSSPAVDVDTTTVAEVGRGDCNSTILPLALILGTS
jgi:hypothetical protein